MRWCDDGVVYGETTISLGDDVEIHVESTDQYGPTAKHWWLRLDGTPVAYLHTLTYPNRPVEQCPFVLCDIEVRPGYRGRGLSRRIVAAAEAAEGHRLHTSGSFTPLGARALGWVPVIPGNRAGVSFDDMDFVADWDTQRSHSSL